MGTISQAGAALMLVFSSMAFAQGHGADTSPPLTDDEKKTVQLFHSFSQCVNQKRTAIRNEAQEIIDRDPAEMERIGRQDGRDVGLTQDNIDRRIVFYWSLDRKTKLEWAGDYLALIRNPRGACIKELGINEERDTQKLWDINKKYGPVVLPAGP